MEKNKISIKAIEPYIADIVASIEQLSKVQRLAICVGTIVLILGAFGYFSIYPKLNKINKLNKQTNTLQNELAVARLEAAKLPKSRKMMKDAQARFHEVKKALPEKKEIPALLTSISQSGHDAGLKFLLFEPKNETPKDFYAEIPVSISVIGSYHNLGLFLSKVASLPRVVNVRDLYLKPEKEGALLNTSCTAVTYKFVETSPKPKNVKLKKK